MTGITIGEGITIEGGISIVIDYGTPQNVTAPTISVVTNPPNIRVGKTLSSTTGTWNSSFPILGYYYQWNNNGVPISGATSSTYVVQSSDLGDYITCSVQGYTTYGASPSTVSNILGPVLPSNTPAIGDYAYGGYYAGTIAGQLLIVADAIAGGGSNSYTNAYNACNALSLNGYTDWVLPDAGEYPVMYDAFTSGYWPAGQAYIVTPTPGRNYWVNANYRNPPYTNVFLFVTNTFDYVLENNTFISYRAIRLQTIPS